MSSLKSAATRLRRQIATGSFSHAAPRRQAGSHGRSQVRPRIPGKHVGLPIDHVGVAVAAGGDQPDVFRNRRVGRTGPLAIHDLVEVVRRRNVGGFHLLLCTHATAPLNLPCASPRRPQLRRPGFEKPRTQIRRGSSGAPLEIPPIHASQQCSTELIFNNPCMVSEETPTTAPSSGAGSSNLAKYLKYCLFFILEDVSIAQSGPRRTQSPAGRWIRGNAR